MTSQRVTRYLTSALGWSVACLLLCLCQPMFAAIVPGGMAFAAGVEILTPRQDSTIIARQPRVHLVLRQVGGQSGQLRVKAGDMVLRPAQDVEDVEDGEAHYLHFLLPLVAGANSFTFLPEGQQLRLTYQAIVTKVPAKVKDLYLFHQDEQLPESCVICHDLRDTKLIPILGLEGQESCGVCHQDISGASQKHSPVVSKLCLTCHQLSLSPWRIGFPTEKIAVVCFACHTEKAAWFSRKYIHGPLKVGGCTLCHDPHGSENRYFLWAEGSLELCVSCHSDIGELLSRTGGIEYVHGLIPDMGCVICHDPHASDSISVLKKPINKLCVGCHDKFAGMNRGHPVASHPLAATRELRRPGRALSCAGCHDPHASKYGYLLIEEPTEGALCLICHKR